MHICMLCIVPIRPTAVCNYCIYITLNDILSLSIVFILCINFTNFHPLWNQYIDFIVAPCICACLICTSCSQCGQCVISLANHKHLAALTGYKMDRYLTQIVFDRATWDSLVGCFLAHYNMRYPRQDHRIAVQRKTMMPSG